MGCHLDKEPGISNMGQSKSKQDDTPTEDFDGLRKQTKFKPQEIQELYRRFLGEYPAGTIPLDAFVRMYQEMFPKHDAEKFAQLVFQVYDKDGNGVVNFREFLTALSTTTRGNASQKLEWSFNLYDQDKNGYISREEASEIIGSIFKLRGQYTTKEKVEIETMSIFRSLDRDRDDKISREEFVRGAQGAEMITGMLTEEDSGSDDD